MIARGIPESSLTIVMASFAEKTLNQYSSSLKSWWTYCENNNYDVFNATSTEVISFLTKKFEDGAGYSTLNTHRSALSIILGSRITLDDSIHRFLRGVYRLKPPQPKYAATWDTNDVLNYLCNFYPYTDNITLEALSHKTISLLAIASAQRMQTLSLIKLKNICVKNDVILIKIPDFIKTSRPGALQPLIRLPFIRENLSICPATVLQAYIEKTSTLRSSDADDHLFISVRKPHKKVCSQTLSHWVKKVLADSGIDISVFGAHSTRHASTSAAHRLGVNLEVVRKAAGWSNSSNVFLKYYNREVNSSVDNDFAEVIFNNL